MDGSGQAELTSKEGRVAKNMKTALTGIKSNTHGLVGTGPVSSQVKVAKNTKTKKFDRNFNFSKLIHILTKGEKRLKIVGANELRATDIQSPMNGSGQR